MHSENLQQSRQEVNRVEHLGSPIQTPNEKVEQRQNSVGLVHVVPVFSRG